MHTKTFTRASIHFAKSNPQMCLFIYLTLTHGLTELTVVGRNVVVQARANCKKGLETIMPGLFNALGFIPVNKILKY
jgi:hypothetical protein